MKRFLSLLLSIVMISSMILTSAAAADAAAAAEADDQFDSEICTSEHESDSEGMVHYDAKPATFTGIGWNEYYACSYCGFKKNYTQIPMLEVPVTDNYETFLSYLSVMEELASVYIEENPGKDPLWLIIKYIRTGVDRYNSGSWGIMAGYEDADFAKFAATMEDMLNSDPETPEMTPFFSGLKNLANFTLPNGDLTDMGHMFGTMDITYHNNFGLNHADVAGWAGDLVDLLEFADIGGVSGTLDEMIAEISENYLGHHPSEEGQHGFSSTDIIGDLDAYYMMHQLQNTEYVQGTLHDLYTRYFTETLSMEDRAAFFLKNRLDGASTRSDIRDAVYSAYINNKVVATLEATREFTSANLEDLKKACCYAFADYLCMLAGDYVDDPDRSYYTVFSTEKSTLAPGVRQEINYATTADGEQTKFYLATADITRDDVFVYANYKDNDPTSWGMQRVLDQANAAQAKYGDPESAYYIPNYSVIASINGAGFNMATGQPGGLLVMNGVEYSPIDKGGFFGILKDGTAVIGTADEYNTVYKGQVQEGIAGFGTVLIKNGKITVAHSDTYTEDRASRTAIGITRTGKVVFMVMDGRQLGAGACGGSMQEIAQVLLEAGCVHAINLDGGGSTTYVAKPEGKEALEVVSSPSDGVQRSVSTSLMIVSTAPDSTAFDHAIIDSPADYMTKGASMQMTATGVSATGNSAEIPEGAYWTVSDTNYATITADGILTASDSRPIGSVTVNLMHDGSVIGSKQIDLVIPDNVYFTKENINAVYGEQVVLPVQVLYERKAVAFTTADVEFSIDNAEAGTVSGDVFTVAAADATTAKVVQITASLKQNPEKTAKIKVSLYKQGELTFDFDQAIGGNRQLAWDRQVTNSTTDDNLVYTVVDSSEKMVTNYTLALDMSQIPVPQQLEDLIYMLPGADMEGASAWMFLCNLAERVSDMTVVTPTVQFSPDVDVDISELKLINDYFELTNVNLDEETNTMTLTLHWKKIYNAIDITTANPLCIVNGIRVTPKDDAAWSSQNRLNIVNSGDIGYTIYLRASSLVTFASKPENQEVFGLYPYHNPNNDADAGAYFSSVYAEFEDSYTLVNSIKSGWILGDNGYSYYLDGEKLTGIQKIGDLYYDLGDDGINLGKTPFTGIFEIDENQYYARDGKLLTEGWYTIGDKEYHIHADSTIHEATVTSTKKGCLDAYTVTKTCTDCGAVNKSEGIFPKGHDWDYYHRCKICGTQGQDITDVKYVAKGGAVTEKSTGFGSIGNVRGSEYYYAVGGVRPSFFVTMDGTTPLNYSNDNNLNPDGTIRDLYISWKNDRGIGKAVMNIVGRGNYYGETKLEYTIVPNDVTNLRVAEATSNSLTLTWDKAAGAGYYRLYQVVNGSNKLIVETTETTCTVTGLSADTEYKFVVATSAVSTDGENKTYNRPIRPDNALTAKTAPMPESLVVIDQAVLTAGDQSVKLIADGDAFFLLPPNADLTDAELSLTLNGENVGNTVVVSGDLGSVYGTAAKTAFDLTKLAAADADGNYTVGIKVGEYNPVTVKVICSYNIPSLVITSDDPEQGRAFVDAAKGNETTAQMTLTGVSGEVIYDGALTQIKARGNSTYAHYDKKSYQIKLDEKADLIGQNETVRTWALLANYGDATLMHDKFFKDLAAQMDMPYVAGSEWVNVWYDGEYRGVYLLSEKNSVGSTSVDITDMEDAYKELNPTYGESMQINEGVNKYGQAYAYTAGLTDPETITGGFLIELNHAKWDEANGFKTAQGVGFNVKSPEWASDAAMKYISEYYQEFEDAVYATDAAGNHTGYNAETGKYFYEYVDMDSLVKVFLLQELALNPDGFISSLYFYKDVDGLMYAGPIWDQDMTLGTGWTKYISSSIVDYHYLAEALIKIPAFKDRVIEYYTEELAPMAEAALADGGMIDGYYAQLAENAEWNYILWPYIRVGDPAADGHIWANASYDAVVDDMKAWLDARLDVLADIFAPEYEPGDANHDGKADSTDAVAILRKLAGYEVAPFYADTADFNGDGKADSTDAVAILRKLAGY